MNLPYFQRLVARWGRKTFPDSDAGTIADHLAEEMIELLGTERVNQALLRFTLRDNRTVPPAENPAEESADILLLLLHLADRLNFSLAQAAGEKFVAIQNARWEDDGRGYKKRVKG